MNPDVQRRIAVPALRPLWARLVERWGAAGDRGVASVSLDGFEPATLAALSDLLGSERLFTGDQRVRLVRIADALGLDDDDLRLAVVDLLGPIDDQSRRRQVERNDRAQLWEWLSHEAVTLGLDRWQKRLRAAGVPGGDVDAHQQFLDTALKIVARLPADPISLAAFAALTTGDPHGLDRGQRLAAIVLDAVAEQLGEPRAASAAAARRLWSMVGVVTDELSSNVLLYRIRSVDDHPLAPMLCATDEAGEPLILTLSQLRRWPLQVGAPARVLVVENPSVVADAARTGWDGPMVCTSGWPNVAVTTALNQLRSSGCHLDAHADFDVAGIRILHHLIDRCGAEPWAMTAAHYEAAVAGSTIGLTGSVPATPWDPKLKEAMTTHRVSVHEEQVLNSILAARSYPG